MDTFAFPLPAQSHQDPSLVAIPCLVQSTEMRDALIAVHELVAQHFALRARLEYDEHWSAWERAVTSVRLAARNRKRSRDPSKLILARYRETISRERLTPLPQLFVLVSGDTGSGKTTLTIALARELRAERIDLRNVSASHSLPAQVLRGVTGARGNDDHAPFPFIIVLDAFDKMSPGATHEQLQHNIREVRASTAGYAVVIMTVRTQLFRTLYEERLHDTTRVQLLPLTASAIQAFADRQGVRGQLEDATSRMRSIGPLATNPLLLNLLSDLIRQGEDISKIEDHEHLFTKIIEAWVNRDSGDSILPADLRLKCMQLLAFHALATAGRAFRYADIASVIAALLHPEGAAHVERFNTDLRVCGFLRRFDPDKFEFVHASFYEYLVARTIFEDLERGDFSVLELQPINEEIIAFVLRRAMRSRRVELLKRTIVNAWNSGPAGSRTRANLLRLASRLNIPAAQMPLDGLTITDQDLTGVTFRHSATDVRFSNCDFAGARFESLHGTRWAFKHCNLRGITMSRVRLDLATVEECAWMIDADSHVTFVLGTWSHCVLEVATAAQLVFHGGSLADSVLRAAKSQGPVRRSAIQFAVMDRVDVEGDLGTYKIDECSIDLLSLYSLSCLPRAQRPRFSKGIARAVKKWTSDAGSAAAVRSPRVLTGTDVPVNLSRPTTRTQKRKRHKEDHMLRRIMDPRLWEK